MISATAPLLSSFAVACAVLWMPGASAATGTEHQIDCPLELPQEAVRIIQPPSDWAPFVRTGVRLSSAEPMFGPASEKGYLKPTSTKVLRGKSVDIWRELGGPMPSGKWIACNYGDHNEFILSKRIDDNTSECTVANSKDKQGRVVVDVRCAW